MKVAVFISGCLLAAFMLLSACGSSARNDDSVIAGIEQGEAEDATIEAAIMQGRTAARGFINANAADTLDLQNRLLEARAMQSRYVTAGKPDMAAAFDTAFIHTLKAVRPEVAQAIEQLP